LFRVHGKPQKPVGVVFRLSFMEPDTMSGTGGNRAGNRRPDPPGSVVETCSRGRYSNLSAAPSGRCCPPVSPAVPPRCTYFGDRYHQRRCVHQILLSASGFLLPVRITVRVCLGQRPEHQRSAPACGSLSAAHARRAGRGVSVLASTSSSPGQFASVIRRPLDLLAEFLQRMRTARPRRIAREVSTGRAPLAHHFLRLAC